MVKQKAVVVNRQLRSEGKRKTRTQKAMGSNFGLVLIIFLFPSLLNHLFTIIILQAFCYKARSYLSTRSRTAHQISPFYEDRTNSFFVADMDKLFDMDFSDSQLIFISLVNVSKHYYCITVDTNYNNVYYLSFL